MSRRPRFSPNSPAGELAGKIERRSARVAVIGLGYVGLPLAVEFGKAGFEVAGIDIDKAKVASLARGRSHVQDVSSADVRALVRAGRFKPTTDFSVLRRADTVNICVPTPLSKQRDPDVSYIVASAKEVARHVRRGMLVVLESTTYPGTTDELILPLLQQSGMKVGRDFFLAFSPERVDPGNPKFTTRNIPKVVGGVTPVCTELACRLYAQRLDRVVAVSSTQVAEMVKLLENTFRSVNIGLVNELALMCKRLKIDVWEVIEAAATKPFGFMPFFPGPGLGGHCQDGDEFVFVRRDGGVDAVRMRELEARRSRKVGDVQVTPLDDVEVLSFDLERQKPCFRRATHLFKRWYPRLVTLQSAEGRRLTVTDGHPMIVQNGHGIETRRADEVNTKSRFVLAMDLPKGSTPEPIDLVSALSLAGTRTRVAPREGAWIDHWDRIRKHARRARVEKKDLRRSNTLPLDTCLELERAGVAPFGRRELLLATGRGAGHSRVPWVVAVTPEFARLIGYYLSEGCLTRDKSLRTRWTFGSHETELIDDLTGILDQFGFAWSLHRVKRWKAVQIKVSSNLFGRLIGDHLGCGRRSEEMRIPPLLMGAPTAIRRGLLAGLLNGDGSVDWTTGRRAYVKNGRRYVHRNNAACVSYFTSSPRLLQQATLLMHSLELVPSVKRGKPELRLFGEAHLRAVAPLFRAHKRAKLEGYLNHRAKPMPSRRVRQVDGVLTVEPGETRSLPRGGWVYSIEVPGTQTYVTSYGMVSHNCIPIDPFYLSWKARSTGFEARFIELAGYVNGQMPGYSVDLVAQSLNKRGIAVKGARVLVLGVAYKGGIDDVRESPSLDIMTTLEERGAHVEYSDPFVPKLEFEGRKYTSVPVTPARLRRFDCVVIATAHIDFPYGDVVRYAKGIVDTRNALKGRRSNKIVRL
ncbi:MAG TPA: nucleotide sugar dehydrogenase [Candidatus Eisenbacteria bacterium]|nr:nucleotide sugar dehydrogenase [Candidatus Eisenbacteria bacterium]